MVDTMGDFVAALNAMLSEQGLPAVNGQLVSTMVGKDSEPLIHAVLRHVGLSNAFYRYLHNYLGIDDNIRPFMPARSQVLRGCVHAGFAWPA